MTDLVVEIAPTPVVVEVGNIGIQGPEGPAGPIGPSGTASHTAQTDDTLLAGSPVYATGTSTWKLAGASGLPQARLAGLSEAGVAATFAAAVTTQGLLTFTTAEWDAVTGQSGGLTPGAAYWVSATTGMLTTTSPTVQGEFSTKAGRAMDTTTMDIDPRNPILL